MAASCARRAAGSAGRSEGGGTARTDDARTEDRPDGAARHPQRHTRGRAQVPPRLGAERRWRFPRREQARERCRLGRARRRLLRRVDGHCKRRARDSDHVGHGCRARSQQRHRRDLVSAQHRARRCARSRLDGAHRHGHRDRGGRDRARLDLRTSGRRGARRSLGSHLRKLFRRSRDRARVRRAHGAWVTGRAGL